MHYFHRGTCHKDTGFANLNAILAPGDYQIYVKNANLFQSKSNFSGNISTYEIKDYISITGYSNFSYGPVANWVVEKSLACDPIPVLVNLKPFNVLIKIP